MKYKVLQYFQLGSLKLEKNQIILIEDYDESREVVSINHYPEKQQLAGIGVANSFLKLKLIEKY